MLTRWFDTSVFPAPLFGRRSWFEDDLLNVDRRLERLWHHAQGLQGFGAPRFAWQVSDTEATLRAELPGLAPEDLKLVVQDGKLTLEGQRAVRVPEGYRALRQERLPLRFSQTFTLAKELEADKTEAKFEDGILTLRIPKRPEVQPRVIPITPASEEV